MKPRSLTLLATLAGALVLATAAPVAATSASAGAVYVMSNSAGGNTVIAYGRDARGALSPLGSFSTGGLGSGAGLGSQGAITLTDDGRFLLAVNAGSDDVTTFRIRADHRLTLVDRVAAGGDHPISATSSHGLVYVLSDGGSGGIAGFRLDRQGRLRAIAGSTEPLSTAASGPAEIAFDPSGTILAVTEKATNRITTYAVRGDGRASHPSWTASAGVTPFGFDFDLKGHLIATEAAGGAPNASTVSSYRVRGRASVIDGPVATTETAACWLVTSANGRFAFAANTGSGTITTFAIAPDGNLTRLAADGVSAVTPGPAADLGLSRNGRFLYVRAGATIYSLAVGHDGSLTNLGSVAVTAGIVGLAAE